MVLACGLAALSTGLGCGRETARQLVVGSVTLDEAPLDAGEILFIAADKSAASRPRSRPVATKSG